MAKAGDILGLRRLFGATLPLTVAAMVFLAALALAGAQGASLLARQWRVEAAASLTVQVPRPAATLADSAGRARSRREIVLALLNATPGLEVRALGDAEVADLLRPWLGPGAEGMAMPLPAVIAVHVTGGVEVAKLGERLAAAAPGTMLEAHDPWVRRLGLLARSLENCALLALAIVAGLAALVVSVVTRAGLAARREAVEIVHGLGATDGLICGRFANRAGWLALLGGLLGVAVSLPVVMALAVLAAPFAPGKGAAVLAVQIADPATWRSSLSALPPGLWAGMAALAPVAAVIGWLTARLTVRSWLRRLP